MRRIASLAPQDDGIYTVVTALRNGVAIARVVPLAAARPMLW